MKTEDEMTNFLKNGSLKSICRICLTECDESYNSLFEKYDKNSLSEKVMLCARVQIDQNDGLPATICQDCCKQLVVADDFRTKCEYSDNLLRKVFLKCSSNNNLDEIKDDINDNGLTPVETFENVEYIKDEFDDILKNDDSIETFPDSCAKEEKKKKRSSSSKAKKTVKLQDNNVLIPELEIKSEILYPDDDIGGDILRELEKNSNDYNIEIDKTVENRKYICHLCSKPLISKISLEKHINKMHNPEKIKSLGNIKITGYGVNRRFHCSECEYTSKYNKTLLCHLRIHTGEKPYQCEFCESRFAQYASLSSHRKRHSDQTYFTCALCGKQFKYKKAYEAHKRVHTKERNYVCKICNKGLTTPNTLNEHMKRHLNIKNFSCELCGGVFVSRSELSNHSKVHNPDRRFRCSICEFNTYTKKKLEEHIKRHTGDRSHKCSICDHSFYTAYALKSHMRSHSKEKKYPCPECELKFKHSSKVNRHVFKVHGKKYKWNDNVDRRIIK